MIMKTNLAAPLLLSPIALAQSQGTLTVGCGLNAEVFHSAADKLRCNQPVRSSEVWGPRYGQPYSSMANWSRFSDGLANLGIRALAISQGQSSTLYVATDEIFAIALAPEKRPIGLHGARSSLLRRQS
jgi:hypothetical protein